MWWSSAASASDEARGELDRIARAANVKLDPAAAEALVEALAADVGRIAIEIEKLSLYGKPITADDLPLLVPDARQSTIFALVNALGRRDRARSLETLDALVREGEYLPLALTFLATQFRMALVAKEANLRGASQVQGHFQRAGVQMWGSRAEQVSADRGEVLEGTTGARAEVDFRDGSGFAKRASGRPHGGREFRDQSSARNWIETVGRRAHPRVKSNVFREFSRVKKQEIIKAWGKILRGERPSLSLEITRECPLRCPGCYAYDSAIWESVG